MCEFDKEVSEMVKENYEEPIALLVKVETKDIITYSEGIELPDDELE